MASSIESGNHLSPSSELPAVWDHGGVVEFTQWALDILRRSHEAARRFNPDATVRVFREGGGVRFVLTDQPEQTDQRIDRDGFVLLVEEGIEGTIDVVEPHDQLILRPGGSPQ
jgi:hypothetical protein